jgi:hypothetical protein
MAQPRAQARTARFVRPVKAPELEADTLAKPS